MNPLNKKDNMPITLIIEGLWGSGKSTLISNIRQSCPVLFIPEPNYKISGVRSSISRWYRSQHKDRILLAKKYTELGENVVMERSILSSVAFYYAQYKKLPKWFDKSSLELFFMPNMYFIFLYKNKDSFLKDMVNIEDSSVVKAISKNKDFYENYINFYKEILVGQTRVDIVCFEILKDFSNLEEVKLRANRILNKVRVRRKLEEMKKYCASAAIFYKNKLLLIHSPKHFAYSLPHGHKEKKETLIQTISREIVEETGFIDFQIIKQICSYSYRFFHNGKIIHKTITCFLVKLNSLKKTIKKFESHEFYTNHFFNYKNSLSKTTWPEEKEIIKSAYEIMDSYGKGPAF